MWMARPRLVVVGLLLSDCVAVAAGVICSSSQIITASRMTWSPSPCEEVQEIQSALFIWCWWGINNVSSSSPTVVLQQPTADRPTAEQKGKKKKNSLPPLPLLSYSSRCCCQGTQLHRCRSALLFKHTVKAQDELGGACLTIWRCWQLQKSLTVVHTLWDRPKLQCPQFSLASFPCQKEKIMAFCCLSVTQSAPLCAAMTCTPP